MAPEAQDLGEASERLLQRNIPPSTRMLLLLDLVNLFLVKGSKSKTKCILKSKEVIEINN
jgi:hypothetical protein